MSERRGGFIITHSGGQFWPLDPREPEVEIADIAHALSQVIRWTGHSPVALSVAQHCVNVSFRAATIARESGHRADDIRRVALSGVLHDSAEAYISDLASPVKRFIPQYVEIEKGIERVIGNKYGVVLSPMDPIVKQADCDKLKTEASMYFPTAAWWQRDDFPGEVIPHLSSLMEPLSPRRARAIFLRRFEELTR